MTYQSEAIQQAAQALALARANRHPIPPVSTSHGIASLDAAYAVARQSDGGLVVCGVTMKSSNTSDPCVLHKNRQDTASRRQCRQQDRSFQGARVL